ncbi:pimeloyl-ACP methyl ester carboxylesterase [Sphingomonas zeicaulis]|uniref:alpha/beta fold hydrolase n=1 Tax=Sphingomonas zeicaulis TaxID=1632740 RepID=UPI003D1DFACE
MFKVTVAAGLMAMVLAGPAAAEDAAEPPTVRAERCVPPSPQDSRWDGLGVLKGGKGYAATPMGQVHYRLMGPEDGPVLVLIHQTPWSIIEFADIQPCLAARGIRTLAIDTPGYGMSDAPAGKPTIAAYAENMLPVLDALHIRKAAFAGHHTGAAIVAAFAARHGDRVTGVILHGAPNYNDAERAQRRALPHPDLSLKPDGSHLSAYYDKLFKAQGAYPRNLATINWSTLNMFLAGASDVAHEAVYANDMAGDLKRIEAPLLVLSDGKDALNAIDERTGAMKPNFRYEKFSDGSAHMLMVEPARWSDIAAEFLREAVKR